MTNEELLINSYKHNLKIFKSEILNSIDSILNDENLKYEENKMIFDLLESTKHFINEFKVFNEKN